MVPAQGPQCRMAVKSQAADLITIAKSGGQQRTQRLLFRSGPEPEMQFAAVGLDPDRNASSVQVNDALPAAVLDRLPGQGRDLQSHGGLEIQGGLAGNDQFRRHRRASAVLFVPMPIRIRKRVTAE
ncbi:hypothetical protein ABT297_30340 [Dactylosporangium sp. NPDC000555]|uniref:hypothetical protein n=1 Tax=Dactylosporangium sp. NPDC000555 TaxID=3154260 RepID=UPI0033268987